MSPAQRTTVVLEGPVGSMLVALLRGLGNNSSRTVIASAAPDPQCPLTIDTLAIALGWLGYDVSQGRRARERWHQSIDGAVVIAGAGGSIAGFVRRAGHVSSIESASIGAPAPMVSDPAEAARLVAGALHVVHV